MRTRHLRDTGAQQDTACPKALADARVAWKLFNQREDGSLGPLFINKAQRLHPGIRYAAECHPTPGYKLRPGWHACSQRKAPHLSKQGRVWAKVLVEGLTPYPRPACQGGLWFTAQFMTIIEVQQRRWTARKFKRPVRSAAGQAAQH